MNPALRKAILFGVGVYHLSREKVESFVQELQKEGALSPQEGKKIVEEVVSNLDKEKDRFAKELDRVVRQAMTDLNMTGATQAKPAAKSAAKPAAKKAPAKKVTKPAAKK